MPIVIGAKAQSGFQDPIGLLADCHRRIERFLSVLVQIALQAQGKLLTGEQREALDTALRYFREAAPKHTADEEQSLFPRLRQIDRPEVTVTLAQVEALEKDHARAEKSHAEVDRLGRLWLASGTLSPADVERLTTLLVELADLYRGHISVEEHHVFPMAARVLGAGERQAIGAEMAKRRGLGPITLEGL